jgi:2-dehydropantoate 2-reductase
MYFDRMAGRFLESEALTGAIVAIGERHGIATPLNCVLPTVLRATSGSQNLRNSPHGNPNSR